MKISKQLCAQWRTLRQPKYRWLWCLVAAGIYGLILALPLAGFTPEGKLSLAVFGVTAFLWGTSTLPLAVTGLIVLLIIPVSGALDHSATYSYFGNRAVFFILGAFILVSPIMRSGLSTRLALAVVFRFGYNQNALIGSILGLAAAMSFVISSHAVAAMLFPVVLQVVQAAGAKPGGRFGQAAFLALAWGAGIGGIATLLGGARAALALGILRRTTGFDITFSQWVVWSLPLVILLLLVAYGLLLQIGKGTAVSLTSAQKVLAVQGRQLGPIRGRETGTIVVVVLTVVLWIFKGTTWGLDTVALLGVVLSFVFGLADWQEVEEDVNWGIFLMYGSAIALSAILRDTGAASALATNLLTNWINSPLVCFVAIVTIIIFLTEGMSNGAAVAVLMPIALVLAEQYGVDARAMTLGVTLPSGLAFMLPVSSPTIAIVINSGYVSSSTAFRRGLWLKLIGFLLFIAMAKFYWPLFDLGV